MSLYGWCDQYVGDWFLNWYDYKREDYLAARRAFKGVFLDFVDNEDVEWWFVLDWRWLVFFFARFFQLLF